MSSSTNTSGVAGSIRTRTGALLAAAAIALGSAAAPAFAGDADQTTTGPPTTTATETTPPASTPVETTPPTTAPTQATPDSEPPVIAPAPAPPSTALVDTTDGVPPALGLASVRTNLEDARRHGLRVTYRVTEPVTLRADVLIYGEVVDRELRMCALPAAGPGESLAKATLWRTPVGTNVVRLPFNVPSKRTLKKFLKITVRVRLIATDASGSETTVIRAISLKRR